MPVAHDAIDTGLLQARQLIAYALAASFADPRSAIAQQPLGDHAPILIDAWETNAKYVPRIGTRSWTRR